MRRAGPNIGFHPAMRTTLTLSSLFLLLSASAQVKGRIFKTDTGTVAIRYFTNGAVSTKQWTDKNDRWGRSWAYKRDGTVIVEHQTRRFAGHAGVTFSYHPNGAISKAEYSDAPDAGIQWYRSTATFDEEGKQLSFSEQGHDNDGPIPHPDMRIVRAPGKKGSFPQEAVEEQRLFINELFVVNPTTTACRVVATAKQPSPALPGGTWTMAPGDTVRIGAYTMGETFPDWRTQADLSINEVVLGDRYHAVARIRTDEQRTSSEHRKLFVVIEGWISPKRGPERDRLPGLPEPAAP